MAHHDHWHSRLGTSLIGRERWYELWFIPDRHVVVSYVSLDSGDQVQPLAEAGIGTSVGSVGVSYDNALAESITGLFKAEVINFLGPWKPVSQVEWETLKWVDWYSTERQHRAIR